MIATGTAHDRFVGEPLSRRACEAALLRICFGHLAFVRDEQLEVLPIRYAYLDGWVYFRADRQLQAVIARRPWLALAVTESRSGNYIDSIIVRGGCYHADRTGSSAGNAAALRGVVVLRDRAPIASTSRPRVPRTSTVYRLHADTIEGTRTFVPCPPGERPYDAAELQQLSDIRRSHTASDDDRADDDGMAEAPEPIPAPSPRTRARSEG
jgi:nitroimidazol reductase NimA-like FMN-containing flavoprotein (pyridoxamine 5'-phosphate oxidase superfamily)